MDTLELAPASTLSVLELDHVDFLAVLPQLTKSVVALIADAALVGSRLGVAPLVLTQIATGCEGLPAKVTGVGALARVHALMNQVI